VQQVDVSGAGWHCQATCTVDCDPCAQWARRLRLGSRVQGSDRNHVGRPKGPQVVDLSYERDSSLQLSHALLCILGWPATGRLSSFRPRIPAGVKYDLRLGPNLRMCVGHLYFWLVQERRCRCDHAVTQCQLVQDDVPYEAAQRLLAGLPLADVEPDGPL